MTKDQERKALEKIAAILEETGRDSYLNMTFEGILEQAEENITNDFACNYKEMYEEAQQIANEKERDADALKEEINDLEEEVARLKGFNEKKSSRIDELNNEIHDASGMIGGYIEEIHALKAERDAMAQEIITLKAKLYDLMNV